MTQIPESTDKCYKQLSSYNGKFNNGLSFNFDKPQIFNEPPYQQSLLGDLLISTRNHISKYQGNYILYIDKGNDIIRLKILSNDKNCKLILDLPDEEKTKASYDTDAIVIKFENFIDFINNSKFTLE